MTGEHLVGRVGRSRQDHRGGGVGVHDVLDVGGAVATAVLGRERPHHGVVPSASTGQRLIGIGHRHGSAIVGSLDGGHRQGLAAIQGQVLGRGREDRRRRVEEGNRLDVGRHVATSVLGREGPLNDAAAVAREALAVREGHRHTGAGIGGRGHFGVVAAVAVQGHILRNEVEHRGREVLQGDDLVGGDAVSTGVGHRPRPGDDVLLDAVGSAVRRDGGGSAVDDGQHAAVHLAPAHHNLVAVEGQVEVGTGTVGQELVGIEGGPHDAGTDHVADPHFHVVVALGADDVEDAQRDVLSGDVHAHGTAQVERVGHLIVEVEFHATADGDARGLEDPREGGEVVEAELDPNVSR